MLYFIDRFSSSFIAIIITIVVSFFFVQSIQDSQERLMRESTEAFIDDVKEKGYISLSMYEEYMQVISKFQVEVFFYHRATYNTEGIEAIDQKMSAYIVRKLYEDGIYKLNQNNNRIRDEFRVDVIERSPNILVAFISMFSSDSPKEFLVTHKGGRIFHVPYD